jgi:hypothetical protein
MNDMWVLEPQDDVTALSDKFWENYARGCSVVKSMFLIVRYDEPNNVPESSE